jgi:hypothetical protein
MPTDIMRSYSRSTALVSLPMHRSSGTGCRRSWRGAHQGPLQRAAAHTRQGSASWTSRVNWVADTASAASQLSSAQQAQRTSESGPPGSA